MFVVSAVRQRESAKYTYIPSLWALPPAFPSRSVITERQAELAVLKSNFPLAICFTRGSVYRLMLLYQFVTLFLYDLKLEFFSQFSMTSRK